MRSTTPAITHSQPAERKEMRIYPDLKFDRAKYHAALSRSIDNPVNQRLVELRWHGTEHYQKHIQRDGFDSQQKLLAHLREKIADATTTLARTRKAAADADANASKADADAQRMQDEYISTDINKPGLRGRLESHNKKVEQLRHAAVVWDQTAARHRKDIQGINDSLSDYQNLARRLEAALVYFMENQPKRSDPVTEAPPPAPVINVNVQPTPINLEAAIHVPPMQDLVITKMPARKTTTRIERNGSGEIVKSTQIEEDA